MRGVFCDGQSARFRHDLPEPVALPGELMLDVRAVGICETDLQLARGYMGFQGVLGHEFLGLTPDGQRVTAEINNACQHCPTCAAGRPGHCPNRTVLGIFRHDGAMAERVAVPKQNLHAIPDAIDDRAAVFIEPLAAAIRITEQVTISPETTAAVVGDGRLGLLCAWVLRDAGARVTLIGKHREKLDLAGGEVQTVLLDESSALGRPFDLVVDATGSPSGLPTALGLVRPCGTVVLKTTVAREYQINLAPIVIDEIQVLGSRCGPFPKAIAALREQRIDVRPLIGSEFPLDQANAALEAAARPGARKILIRV